MPLPLLNWKFVGTKVIPKPAATAGPSLTGTLPWTLDSIYQLGILTTYADGSPRVPGSGSAWTWAQDGVGGSCVAAYGVPATTTAVGMKYIFAGDGATTTYAKITPDTTATSGNLLVGMNRSSGAYAGAGAWATATPFTTASSFSGYYRMLVAPFPVTNAAAGVYSVTMWESQEACIVQVNTYGLTTFAVQMGALYDPLTYTSGVSAESDGRLYYLVTSGGTVNAAFLSNTTATAQAYTATPGTTGMRSGYFVPGTNTVGNAFRGGTWTPGTTFVNLAGRVALYPFWAQNTAGQFLGAARNFYIVRDAANQSAWMSGLSMLGYTAGASINGVAGDTVILGT